jgi:hypothetical protein
MTDMFLERVFDSPLSPDGVMELAARSADCFAMHRVDWHGSCLSNDGQKMFCWFRAPDMESARIAMRQIDADTRVFWRGSVHDAPDIGAEDLAGANVLVERRFDDGVTLEQIQEIEDAGIGCLESRNVRFIRTFFSADNKRMICLYDGPDAESVRQAQREAGVPFEEAWTFRAVGSKNAEDAII